MKPVPVYGPDHIRELLPHRPPFLFVDDIIRFAAGRSIEGRYTVPSDAFWCEGHFPGEPIMPGVLLADALAQTSGLLWGFTHKAEEKKDRAGRVMFHLASVNIKFLRPAGPGDMLLLCSLPESSYGMLHRYRVEARIGTRAAAKGILTLSMIRGQSG